MIDVKKAIADPQYYMENALWIRTKSEALIPFKLNRPQRKVHSLITSLKASNRPVRIVCLKARQMGMSTFFGGLLFHRTATRNYVTSVVTAHKDDPSLALFNMHSLFYNRLPSEVRPMKKYSSKRELSFENPRPDPDMEGKDLGLQSKLSVYTGASEDLSRSRTIHNLHWSEAAFTRDAEDVHGVVLSAVPKPPAPSMVFYESTANGPTGLFHDLFWEAWRGESDWTPVFLPWHEMQEYRMEVPPSFVLDENEVALRDKYDLDDEQIVWRRYVLVNDFRGDVSKFMQEYPACPEEAFQASVNCVFDMSALNEMEEFIREPDAFCTATPEGLVQENRIPAKDDKGVIRGLLQVWQWPKPGVKYVMGIDAAGGLGDGDYLVAQILALDGPEVEQAAMYVDKVHPGHFATMCARIADVYNKALISPERNAHGIAIIGVLMEKGYYKMHMDEDGHYGIHVGPRNKYGLVDGLGQLIWRRRLVVHDMTTLSALRSYQEKNNRFLGKLDDFVDSLRVGVPAIPRAYLSSSPVPYKPVTGRDWDMGNWTHEDLDRFIEKNTQGGRY